MLVVEITVAPSSGVLISTTASLVPLWVATMTVCIWSYYSCVILAELQAETEGYANC